MKKISKYITTICFLLLIGGFYVFSIYPAGAGIKSMFIGLSQGQRVGPAVVESVYREKFPAQNFFVSINGGFQRLMGIRYVNTIAKLDNGYITYLVEEADMTGLAANTVEFRDGLAERGIPFLYVNAPFKVGADDKMLPVGVEDYSNENADRFLEILRENDVNVLDLRQEMRSQNIDHYASFFATDHHWTPETGFWAVSEVVDRLSKIDSSFSVDEKLLDLSNYNIDIYEKALLGSSGRRTGPLYAGVDDFPLITPKFDTSLRFYASRESLEREGSFRDTLIFEEHLEQDSVFYPLTYVTYCGSDYALLELSNRSSMMELEMQSTPKRIVLIKDSFSEVVIPFLSLCYDEILCIDMRTLYRSAFMYIDEFQPDAVVVLYNPGAYVNNDVMFEFDMEAAD